MLRDQVLGQYEVKIVGTHENQGIEGRKARIVVDEDRRFMDNSRPSHAGLGEVKPHNRGGYKLNPVLYGKYTFAGVMELVDVPDSKSGA